VKDDCDEDECTVEIRYDLLPGQGVEHRRGCCFHKLEGWLVEEVIEILRGNRLHLRGVRLTNTKWGIREVRMAGD
jgi:hypothetical protein